MAGIESTYMAADSVRHAKVIQPLHTEVEWASWMCWEAAVH